MSFDTLLGSVRAQIKRSIMLTPFDFILAGVADGMDHVGPRIFPSPTTESAASLIGGSELILPPHLPSARRLRAGTYEPEVSNLVRSLLKPGMTFVDVGANVGYYALMCSSIVGTGGAVYAFEPSPDPFRYLISNIGRNGVTNVVATNAAVTDRQGSIGFIAPDLERGHVTVVAPATGASLVRAITLDDFFSELRWPPINLIKLDVEGGEIGVLKGMSRLSARNPELRLIMEVNMSATYRAGSSSTEISRAVSELGFQNGYIVELDLRPVGITGALPKSGLVYNVLLTK